MKPHSVRIFRYQSDKDKFDSVLKRCLKARPSRGFDWLLAGNQEAYGKNLDWKVYVWKPSNDSNI